MKLALLALAASLAFAPAAVAQKKKPLPPADGTEFKATPGSPKYVVFDLEFRDPKDEKWPNFLYGQAAGPGAFTWNAKAPTGAFAFTADKLAQKNGDQDRKVLADLLAGGKMPKVEFAVKGFGPVTQEKAPKNKTVDVFPVKATLTMNGKAAALDGTGRVKFGYPKDAEYPNEAFLTLAFTAAGTDLGLKSADPVAITAHATLFKEFLAAKK